MAKRYFHGLASALALTAGPVLAAGGAGAQGKHYKLAYDQPVSTGYGIAANIFADKPKELSKDTMLSDQYPGAQRGQEPQVRQLVKIDDIKGMKVRVQATPTEDTMFPAYGAQIVHMPFGNVYTSLQTGVVDAAENGVNVYLVNKHYEVAPIMSMTQHEANNNLLWISDKLWSSLTAEQKGWVVAAADEVGKVEPGKALELETQSATKLKGMGVKIVDGVDKSGFFKVASPYLEKMAKDLGPHAA